MPPNPAELITMPETLDLFFSFNFFQISTELDPELGPTLPLLVFIIIVFKSFLSEGSKNRIQVWPSNENVHFSLYTSLISIKDRV